jgi:hypothetical protein
MKKGKNSNILTGIAGVHHVVEAFSRRGMIALPTVRNTAGFDIIVVSKDGRKHANVQVKTSSKRSSFWLMPSPKKKIGYGPKDVYVLLRFLASEIPPQYEGFLLTGQQAKQQVLRRWAELRRRKTRKRESYERFPSVHIGGEYRNLASRWKKRWETWVLS